MARVADPWPGAGNGTVYSKAVVTGGLEGTGLEVPIPLTLRTGVVSDSLGLESPDLANKNT